MTGYKSKKASANERHADPITMDDYIRLRKEIERLQEEVEHYKKDNIRLKTEKMVLFRALRKIRAIEGGDVFEMIKEMQNIADIAVKEMG